MKSSSLAVILVLLLAGTAAASTFDFRDAATFGDAMNRASFSTTVAGNTISVTATPGEALLWWDHTDGFGVQYRYENDEIESVERLKIQFSAPVQLSSVLITDLFNEGYLERGSYQLNGSGNWISFFADQTPSNPNGELTVLLDPGIRVYSITFRSPGELPLLNQKHEFSVAAIETTTVPIPAAVWLLGSGLVGLIALRRRCQR